MILAAALYLTASLAGALVLDIRTRKAAAPSRRAVLLIVGWNALLMGSLLLWILAAAPPSDAPGPGNPAANAALVLALTALVAGAAAAVLAPLPRPRRLATIAWTAALALAAPLALAGLAAAQVPDNRGVRLDPADADRSPAYDASIEDRDRQRADEAIRSGDSSISTITGRGPEEETASPASPPPVDRSPAPATAAPDRPASPEAAGPATPGPAGAPAAAPPAGRRPAPAPVYDAPIAPPAPATAPGVFRTLNRPPAMRLLRYADLPAPTTAPAAPTASGISGIRPRAAALPAIRAGDALYARVSVEANSDWPGPVLVEILQPPLAGAIARGSFRRVRDRLTVRFEVVTLPSGETVGTEAYAVGLDCACYGLRGDVERHWWDRVLLPAALGFAERMLTARSEPPSRVVQVAGETVIVEREVPTSRQAIEAGAAEVARTVRGVATEGAASAITVRLPRDTTLAVMFAAPLGRPAATDLAGVPPPAAPADAAERPAGATSASAPAAGSGPR